MSFEHNISPEFLEAQYQLWKKDPGSLPFEWQLFFRGFDLGQSPAGPERVDAALAHKQSAVQSLIYRYRDIGHLLACTDPLSPCPISHPLLDLSAFGLGEEDLDRTFHTRRFLKKSATLREILDTLQQTYCRSIGVEFMHIQEPGERQWLIDRMEPVKNRLSLDLGQKREILRKLMEAALFEQFLHRKFLGQKRFSLEGGETLIPLLDAVVRKANRLEVRDLVLGMAHRGRINVLANIFRKPLENIFAEFADNLEAGFVGEGDVKYHKGFSTDETPLGEHPLHLTLASNPSHLEAVDPVVEGKSRARQDYYGRDGERRVLPVLIHGDAAFAGQGVVPETLNLSQLEGYRTGGTLHIVLNNQIGFTTTPEDARSTRYATDVAKMLMVPIFHVHGEDPEAALFAAELALDYRQSFARDVVLEVICYRRHGHNEGDEPYFTQPLMYERIRSRPTVHEVYAQRLVEEGLEEKVVEEMASQIDAALEGALGKKPRSLDRGHRGKWSDIRRDWSGEPVETALPRKKLLALGERMTTIPEGFAPNPKVEKLLRRRFDTLREEKGIDWATGESLAFASLLSEGTSVRLSGQDSRRGTFSQRHSTLYDAETEKACVPLAAVAEGGAAFRVFDSMLSEAAVLGFEYGYSLESPHDLVIWEAQFGDFANGAQVIIDQFIVSGISKWDRSNGLVLFLPHGYEGQGAEHSSARIERFLQACAGHNLQVAYPSTPAQLFHLLRRQVRQSFRRPLVVFTPKSLLRHPGCVSELKDFSSGGFREVLVTAGPPEKVKTLLLCSGKIYYDLIGALDGGDREDLAILRLEQLYPLRTDLLAESLSPFTGARRFCWVQEEPSNMGAWSFLRPRLAEILGAEPEYVGREEAAAPAVGSHRLHKEVQDSLVEKALGASPKSKP